ncbi:hypothetical protein [Vibrio ezurae]|uniref:Uncharacterized protein n=1 Tax=Vibrio ezurae NBRC 102218 TaxID=1219080 RepID=U3B6J9_9VIBR|nr:hypothetical protein [Vibrio ezurae]GAD81052.1 hypothetical protein VEZ01S_49_00100 [Vibrio ezurae NBRC 102218]
MNLEFDRRNTARISLQEFCSCMERLIDDELMMQYAVISMHNALQGYMTIYLRDNDLLDTWKNVHAKKWQEVEYPKMLATEGIYQPKRYPQLDFFMDLFDKVFSSKDHSLERESINALNEQRNNFIHFNTDYFTLEKQYALDACAEALKAIIFIASLDRRLFYYEEEQQDFEALCEKAKGQIDTHQSPNK